MGLSEKTCVPCRGGIPALTRAEAESRLAEIPGWSLDTTGTSLQQRFTFKTFAEALAFANVVGALAEKEGHHPTLTIGWGYCLVTLMTNKIKGLHDNDFIMAAKISSLKE